MSALDSPTGGRRRTTPRCNSSYQQDKLIGQRVGVGHRGPREFAELRLTIAAANVPEHLVELLILLDDIDHMLDERRLAGVSGTGLARTT